jgi:beta-glucosidase
MLSKEIKELIAKMTLEEKAGLCSGKGAWHTKAITRLGIPSIMMADGPHGLRKQSEEEDHLGNDHSRPATCFPTAATLACSWDRELVAKIGAALGKECQAEGISILLGPGVNIKRSPLCGRNFEYYAEDPYLTAELATSYVRAVQEEGVGTSLKHFAANNQEHRRMSVDAQVDERTLREIYLAAFEQVVKKAQPWTVMCAYNKLNGEYCAEHTPLLTDLLKKEWGHEGFVVSDWGAVNDRVKGLTAGLELEMPSSSGINDHKLVEAVKKGELAEGVLDQAVERILRVIYKAVEHRKEGATFDQQAHHRLAREAGRECMVLLKNDDQILPLKSGETIAVLGALAKNPQFQGGGSSRVNPTKVDQPYTELEKAAGNQTKLLYAAGYCLDQDERAEDLLTAAQRVAAQAQVAVVFVGSTPETEGEDRSHLRIPDGQRALIEAVTEVQPNVVVVLSNGSPVEMPWLGKVKGVLASYLGGQAAGGAIADLLFGAANPCGKLAETFPQELAHNPSYLNFPGEGDRVDYREGLFVGYRYYDTKKIKPLFPFGYGLSYTTYAYTGMTVEHKEISADQTVTVTVRVKNTGSRAGKEIIQIYIKDQKSSVIRPEKELKAFAKVALAPGEEQAVTFTLDKRAFAYFSVESKDWWVESGEFVIMVGSSAQEIRLIETIRVNSKQTMEKKFNRNSIFQDLLADPVGAALIADLIPQIAGNVDPARIMKQIEYMPLRALLSFSQGKVDEAMLAKILAKLNRET